MSEAESRVVRLVQELVRINSINPTLVPGAPGETEIARYLARWLEAWAPLDVKTIEVVAGRPNVFATLPGHGDGPTLLITTHLDTVGVDHMPDPFSGRIEGDRLFGRGALDIKGGVAAMACALTALAEGARLAGSVILAAVVDEEAGSLGTEHLVDMVRADAAIVVEPTDLQPCLAHRGFAWLEVETIGRAAHGSRPTEGIDAILKMDSFLVELARLDESLQAGPAHPLVGPASLHTGAIRGGLGPSTYPDRCRVGIERRTIPGESTELVLAEIDAIHAICRHRDPLYKAQTWLRYSRPPYEYDANRAGRLLVALNNAIQARLGSSPTPIGNAAWMDSAILGAAGIPTIVFGPGGEGMHADMEYVRISDILNCTAILQDVCIRYCGLAD